MFSSVLTSTLVLITVFGVVNAKIRTVDPEPWQAGKSHYYKEVSELWHKDKTLHYAVDELSSEHRIGAFNVQRLGGKKFSNDEVVKHLLKIFQRYDLLLVQEVQDEQGRNVQEFIDRLNQETDDAYSYIISDMLGRSSYKEQYLYIYRHDVFSVSDSFIYDDGDEEAGEDTFMREPFIILVESSIAAVGRMAIIGCHIQPKSVQQELNEMINVHKDVLWKWGDVPVAIMGDFNADGSYLSETKLQKLELKVNTEFHWLLENVDTTVGFTNNTYDRIIITGAELKNAIMHATVFNYEVEYDLTHEEAKSISDHYPVEFLLGVTLREEL